MRYKKIILIGIAILISLSGIVYFYIYNWRLALAISLISIGHHWIKILQAKKDDNEV